MRRQLAALLRQGSVIGQRPGARLYGDWSAPEPAGKRRRCYHECRAAWKLGQQVPARVLGSGGSPVTGARGRPGAAPPLPSPWAASRHGRAAGWGGGTAAGSRTCRVRSVLVRRCTLGGSSAALPSADAARSRQSRAAGALLAIAAVTGCEGCPGRGSRCA